MAQYQTEDLIKLARIGTFGNATSNNLAHQAFIHLRLMELENVKLKEEIAAIKATIAVAQSNGKAT